MIGQTNIIKWVDSKLDNLPNFIIFVGGKGSGKRTLAKYIAQKLGAHYAPCGAKVEDVREAIDSAYMIQDKTLYCFENADTMRSEAKNAMLKITEEPPKNARFVMTVEDKSSLLATIISRATVVELDIYTKSELSEYFWTQDYSFDKTKADCDITCSIASTPYEVDKIVEYGKDFLDYVELVMDNIAQVEPANAFKSANKLALKGDEGYDVKLFWEVFIKFCMDRIHDDTLKYSIGICETLPYILKVQRLGVNKAQIYDSWVFKIREVWYDYN